MNIVYRPTTTNCYTHVWRKPVGVVLHSTETIGYCSPSSNGSWHYLVDRFGTVYSVVPDYLIAWHVRAADRHHPRWLPRYSHAATSIPNFHTIGVELVSHTEQRAAGVPYTDAQYTALRDLLADLERRWGPLPVVGHGMLQRDRSDPVMLDWSRAGLMWDDALDGYRFTPEGEDPHMIAELEAKVSELVSTNSALDDMVRDLRAEVDGLNGQNTDREAQIKALREEVEYLKSLPVQVVHHEVQEAPEAVFVHYPSGRVERVPIRVT